MSFEEDIILITGGAGFLGQHIVRLLQDGNYTKVKEIRIVDLKPYENRLKHSNTIPLISYVGDIRDPQNIEHAFENVGCVIHAASFESYSFPTETENLERTNVQGTKNIIDLCIKYNVDRLVYTSTSYVTLKPFCGKFIFDVVVNQTENKAKPPESEKLLIPGYPVSKLKAEKLVLQSNGTILSNGTDRLKTVALRPTLMYGEEDVRFFPALMKLGDKLGCIPRIADDGMRQTVYVGNAAYAHILAKNVLKTDSKKIEGLSMFITDDTPISDNHIFCLRMSRELEAFKVRPSRWSVHGYISYLIALLIELIVLFLNNIINFKLEYAPRSLISFGMSVTLYSRLRADTALNYNPIFKPDVALRKSAKWYDAWYVKYKELQTFFYNEKRSAKKLMLE
jgi:3beta-hydroxy-delta5-steroid dehydrogenase / steroid delta-isomerase